jgi:hypothetical protein
MWVRTGEHNLERKSRTLQLLLSSLSGIPTPTPSPIMICVACYHSSFLLFLLSVSRLEFTHVLAYLS